jgi:oligopeptide/dipeptide ABC transporter ATP-binding protein
MGGRASGLTQVLTIENLYKRFDVKKHLSVHAVNGVDLSIGHGETLGLVGESGCGKTTVGRCIVRLIEPTSGKIVFNDNDITALSEKNFRPLRPKIQIVFQEPYEALNPRKVVRAILEDPLVVEGRLNRAERLRKIGEALEMVDLDTTFLDKYPVQLTQGHQQRVGVARALVTDPQLVVLDEPTSLLDIHFRAEIVILLKRLQREIGVSYLFISHDLVVVAQLSHRIAVMYLGRIVEEGPTKLVFDHPVHPYTQALLAAFLFPDPDQKREGLMLKGEVPSPVNLPDNRCNLAPRCPMVKSHCYDSLPQLEDLGEGHWVACFDAQRAAGLSSQAGVVSD